MGSQLILMLNDITTEGFHAVVIVGYGMFRGILFLTKNSWGVKWGEGGYG